METTDRFCLGQTLAQCRACVGFMCPRETVFAKQLHAEYDNTGPGSGQATSIDEELDGVNVLIKFRYTTDAPGLAPIESSRTTVPAPGEATTEGRTAIRKTSISSAREI